MLTANISIAQRVEDLQEYIKTGRIMEAMTEFYAPNVSMQENSDPPTVGLAFNIEREKQFMAQVKTWVGYEVRSVSVGKDCSAVESAVDFVNQQDQKIHMEQVAIERWRDGKIVSERFYYNTAH